MTDLFVSDMTVDDVEVGREVAARGTITHVGPVDEEGLQSVRVRFHTADHTPRTVVFFAWLSDGAPDPEATP